MSGSLLYAVLVGAAAIALWHPWTARRLGNARWPAMLLRSGHAFLPFGLAIGLAFVATPEAGERVLADIWPLEAFVAGWVGYVVGLRGNVRNLPKLGVTGLGRAMAPSVIASVITGGTAFAVLTALDVSAGITIPIALLFGSAGACSGHVVLEALADHAKEGSATHTRLQRLALSSHADDIVVCGLALGAFASLAPMPGLPNAALAFLLPLAVGVVLGGVAWLLLGAFAKDDEALLLGIAILGVGAGFGAWLEVSPAVVCAVMAATLVSLPGDRASTLRDPIDKLGRPAIVILMVATGMAVAPHLDWPMLWGGVALVLLRALAFGVTGLLYRDTLGRHAGLLSAPGQLGIVICFTFYHLIGGPLTADLLGAVALAAFIDKLYVAWLGSRRAVEVGEVSHA